MVTVDMCCHGYRAYVLSWLQCICVVMVTVHVLSWYISVVMVTVQAQDPEPGVAGAVQPAHV